MRSTEKNCFSKRNASTRVKHRKLQPILEPGNSEQVHNILRVFVHFVIPVCQSNVTKSSHLYHTPTVKSPIAQFVSAPKEDTPPCLPEILRWRGLFGRSSCPDRRLLAADDNDSMFAGSHVAQLLACLLFNDRRVPVVAGLLRERIVIGLGLLCLRLGSVQLLHQMAIRPGLCQRTQQKSQADQARHPDDGACEERTAPGPRASLCLLYADCRRDIRTASPCTRGERRSRSIFRHTSTSFSAVLQTGRFSY